MGVTRLSGPSGGNANWRLVHPAAGNASAATPVPPAAAAPSDSGDSGLSSASRWTSAGGTSEVAGSSSRAGRNGTRKRRHPEFRNLKQVIHKAIVEDEQREEF